MLSYCCSSIRESVWLCTLRNIPIIRNSESLCLGSVHSCELFNDCSRIELYSSFNIYILVSNRTRSEGGGAFTVLPDNKFHYVKISSILGMSRSNELFHKLVYP